jgi:hypothetical protein
LKYAVQNIPNLDKILQEKDLQNLAKHTHFAKYEQKKAPKVQS